jgi:multidrug resistance efflux pump
MQVDVGSEVWAGQVLAELDASDIEARIAAAEANARLARRSFERVEPGCGRSRVTAGAG